MSFKNRKNTKVDVTTNVAGTETVIENKAAKPENTAEVAKKVAELSDIPKMVRVTADLVNIRKEPSTNSEAVKQVTKGAEFRVSTKESTSDFVAIIVDGQVVFIMKSLVEIFDDPVYKAHDVKKFGA